MVAAGTPAEGVCLTDLSKTLPAGTHFLVWALVCAKISLVSQLVFEVTLEEKK